MKVTVRSARKLGLEVWHVYVNGSKQAEFLSEEAALSKAARLRKVLGVTANGERAETSEPAFKED